PTYTPPGDHRTPPPSPTRRSSDLGGDAMFPSAVVRGRQLRIIGHSNFAMTPWDRRRAHLELLEEVQAGRITIDVQRFPLERIHRSEEHTSELQSLRHLVCRLLLEK